MDDDSDQGLINRIKSVIRKKTHHHKGADLTEEIHDLMNEGQAKGLITDEESDMVSGVLELKETTAQSIMIPRTDISSAAVNSTLRELLNLVSECGHTRIPIYRESIDKIVGLLHAKDLLKLLGKNPDSAIPHDIIRKPYFVPGYQKVSELLRDLKEKKTHLAIVTDEYGGTAGIITIEDILEEIVGEIMDEHDADRPLLSILDDDTVLVDARLEIEKLAEHFCMKLPEGEFESVGGFIIHILGKIPKANEQIIFENLEITVKSADDRRIDKLLIRHSIPSSPATQENEQS